MKDKIVEVDLSELKKLIEDDLIGNFEKKRKRLNTLLKKKFRFLNGLTESGLRKYKKKVLKHYEATRDLLELIDMKLK